MKKRKKWKIILPSAMVLLMIGLILCPAHPNSSNDSTYQAFGQIGDLLSSEELLLNKEEINGLLNGYIGEGKDIGSIQIKHMEVDLKDDELHLLASITYGGIPLSITTRGPISWEEPTIVYELKGVHLGKLPVPKGLLIWALEKQKGNQFVIEGEQIKIDKERFPIMITSLEMKGEEIMVKFDREDRNRWILSQIQSKVEENIQEYIEHGIEDLNRIVDDLLGDNQENKVEIVRSSIMDIIENPDNYTQEDIQEIKDQLGGLSGQEKQQVLQSIIPQIDPHSLLQIKKLFGL